MMVENVVSIAGPVTPEERARTGAWFIELGRAIQRGTAPAPQAWAVVILDTDDKAHGWAYGRRGVTWRTISRLLNAASQAAGMLPWRKEPETFAEALTRHWDLRMAVIADQAREAAEEAAAKPYQCELCDRRFATRRGAEQHERQCVSSRRRHRTARYWLGEGGRYWWRCNCDATFGDRTEFAAHLLEEARKEQPVVDFHPLIHLSTERQGDPQ